MKKIIYLFIGFLALLFVVSCEKISDEELAVQAESGVTFVLYNQLSNTANKNSDKAQDYPICSDEDAVSVLLTVDGIERTLSMTALNTDETEVLKLSAGPHSITSFAVMDAAGNAIYVMPEGKSDAAEIYGLTGLPFNFNIVAFTKIKTGVDVMCYNPASYALFGYSWFKYKVYEENEIFFFGDVCASDFEEWHTDPSPYAGQTTNEGYDFPAIFKVDIIKTNADMTTNTVTATNAGWYGEEKPLGISFVNDPVLDEDFEFVINLLMPDNSYVEIHRADLPDGSLSIEGNANGFGGADGVFDFEYGDCSNDDTPSGCETAYAFGGDVNSDGYSNDDNCFINLGFGNWGWTVGSLQAQAATYTFPIWAAAGQCDLSKGTEVGELTVEYNGSTATVTYTMNSGYTMSETQLYVGNDVLPSDNGNPTVAPGQYGNIHDDLDEASTDTYTIDGLSGDIYVVAHATVCGDFPE